ncbi:MAG: hypothetical protein R2827_05860 [Bdellovibrionales bacterium]
MLPHSTEKLSSPLAIDIVSEYGSKPVNPNETFKIAGAINTTIPLENIQVKWVLPAGVELISGSTNYNLSQLEPGNPHVSEIVLKTHDDSNYQIHMTASSQVEGMSFSTVKQYNTQTQSQIEKSVDELKNKHHKFLKSNSLGKATKKKVFQ